MRYFPFVIILVFALPLNAAEVKNLKTGQTGERVFATYDLAGKPREKQADVTVFIELGGERYTSDKLSLSGDFGKGVNIGVGKKIFWDILRDMPVGFEGEVVWDVEASGDSTRKPVEVKQGSSALPASGKGEAGIDLTLPSSSKGRSGTSRYWRLP